jgi:hypothetical protein
MKFVAGVLICAAAYFLTAVLPAAAAGGFSGKEYAKKGVYEFGGSLSHHSSVNNDSTGETIYIHRISADPDIDYFYKDRIHFGIRPSVYYSQITTDSVNYDLSYGFVPSFRLGRVWGGPDRFVDASVFLGYAIGSTFGHSSESAFEHVIIAGLHPVLKYRFGNSFVNIGLKYEYMRGIMSSYEYEDSHVLALSVGMSFYYIGGR